MKIEANAQNELKKAVAKKASSFVEDGMIVGLGSGSTTTYFIQYLAQRCREEGLHIKAVSSSSKSSDIAKAGGISEIPMDQVTHIDIAVDGADEVDKKLRLIKGGGGALLREKIIATTSQRFIVIVDESKCVETLGLFGLPIEIVPFCYQATISKINKIGYHGKMRTNKDSSLYVTDNGNYIYDINIPKKFPSPEEDHKNIVCLPGVVETGLFFNLHIQLLVGKKDGTIDVIT